jgi:ribosomal protein L37AE/L43A
MSRGYGRGKYSDAIEKVRSQHADSIKPAHLVVECPKCGTKQMITDSPGMRRCMKCGFEFRPQL